MKDVPRLDAYHFYEQDWSSLEELQESFEWEVPEFFNIADYVCDRWADQKNRIAIISEKPGGEQRVFSYWQMARITNQLANHFEKAGIERGDRVGVNVPQKAESALAHLALFKLGAVSVPLSVLFGPDGLHYRLEHSGAKACVVDESSLETFRSIRGDLDRDMQSVLTVGAGDLQGDEQDFWEAIEDESTDFENVRTRAEDNALIIYTSGTTGKPKGVLHAHRYLIGALPGFVTNFSDLSITDRDVYWSPMEWAWLMIVNMVFAPMFYGKTVVAHERKKFDPEDCYDVIERHGVTVFLSVPTALRMMKQVDDALERYDVSELRLIPSGGEEVTQDLVDWGEEVMGAPIQTIYSQTEANLILGQCHALGEIREKRLGKPCPGNEVAILDSDTSEPLEEVNETGEIAVRYEDTPIAFKEYWKQPDKTAEKRVDGWHLMEDLGWVDEDGFFAFVSRKDDVILCSAYRVSPEEVEDHIRQHEAVMNCGVIGIPHETRGEVPKAFVVLEEGYQPSEQLKQDLQEFVKQQLAKYEYPREIEFIDELPTNSIGKIRRVDLRKLEGID